LHSYFIFCFFPPDRIHQVVLRQAAENPELVKDAGTTIVKGLSTSVGESIWSWQVFRLYCGFAVAIASGFSGLFTAFSYFSELGHNVAKLRSDIKDMRSDMKEQIARSDAKFDAYNARFDKYNARFDKKHDTTMSLSFGTLALSTLLMILLPRRS
jgi:hypothetical protein